MAFDKKKFIARFVEEAREHIETLNNGILKLENEPDDTENLSSVLRSAHTVKGASRMLKLVAISNVAHKLEDLIAAVSSNKIPQSKEVYDLLLDGVDVIADLVEKAAAGDEAPEDETDMCTRLEEAASGAPIKGAGPSAPSAPSATAPPEPPTAEAAAQEEEETAPGVQLTEAQATKEGEEEVKAPSAGFANLDKSKFAARFAKETRENLLKLNEDIIKLEKQPGDIETLTDALLCARTIKGSSSLLKLQAVADVSLRVENLLAALRDQKVTHSKELFDLLINGIDTIGDLAEKAALGEQPATGDMEICALLEEAARGAVQNAPASAAPAAAAQSAPTGPANVPTPAAPASKDASAKAKPRTPMTKPKVAETMRISSEKMDALIKLVGEMISNHNRLKQYITDIKGIELLSRKNSECVEQLAAAVSGSNGQGAEAFEAAADLEAKLSRLLLNVRDDMNIQGLLIGELQERSLKMRMLPLSTIFDTFHRAVRDMSRSLGKEVDFEVSGGETELDKKIVEKLGDPLVHMIRNSIDHGIEKPEDRIKAGKPGKGKVTLSAFYEADSVMITLSDDGAGIPIQKIKEKAVQKGLISPEESQTMKDSDATDLIFQPGLTSSAIITDISGRGVGMDVVRKYIVEDMKGSVAVDTALGSGTSFGIRLPLTLAIMRILLYTVSDIVFAMPASSVSEILSVPRDELIDVVDKKAIRLREQLVPVANLHDLLGLPTQKSAEGSDLLILIVSASNDRMGLVIDQLLSEADMVIKPLPGHMKKIQVVSGVAITGKNEIVNVLNPMAVIKLAKEAKDSERLRKRVTKEKKKAVEILVVDDSLNTREIEKEILEAYGYSVTLAGDGVEALEKTKGFKFDVVITDIEMPLMDGFTLTEKLRADDVYKHIPIIIVTSREKEEDKRRGITVGADAYIIKGAFDQTMLVETVQSLAG